MYDPLLFILILCNTYICNTMNQDNQKKKKIRYLPWLFRSQFNIWKEVIQKVL